MEKTLHEGWLFDIAFDRESPTSIDLRQTMKNMAGRLLRGEIIIDGIYYTDAEAEDMAFQILDLLDYMDRRIRSRKNLEESR